MNRAAKRRLVAKLVNFDELSTIDRGEWDFSAVDPAELPACVEWEYPRSVTECREFVGRIRREGNISDFKDDPTVEMFRYLAFKEWPDVRFTELPLQVRSSFRAEVFGDLGKSAASVTALGMEWGSTLLLHHIESLLAHAEKHGAKSALKLAEEFYADRRRAARDPNDKFVPLCLNFRMSDDRLVAGFRKLVHSRRKDAGIEITELRGASNALRQARAKLKYLAAARLVRAMGWENAYNETSDARGRGLYANREEVWRKAAKKGESMLETWKQGVTF